MSMSNSKVQWKVPGVSTSSSSSLSSSTTTKKRKRPSYLKTTIEILLFLVWLFFTGLAGYYFGYDPNAVKCSESSLLQQQQPSRHIGIVETASTIKCEEGEEEVEESEEEEENEVLPETSTLADLPPL